jgi:Protein of unknown function (DUF3179)
MKPLLGLTILNVALILAPPLAALPPIAQTPTLLAVAHAARTLAPVISAALAVALAVRLWRRRTWRETALLAVALACAALSRANILEWMFPSARAAETVEIARFHDVRDEDMVIGVAIGGESRAYPVRYLAYHHMLNDQLGATALLPTY